MTQTCHKWHCDGAGVHQQCAQQQLQEQRASGGQDLGEEPPSDAKPGQRTGGMNEGNDGKESDRCRDATQIVGLETT